eukprot:11613523-Alexandrium_andersonii.AAC.1
MLAQRGATICVRSGLVKTECFSMLRCRTTWVARAVLRVLNSATVHAIFADLAHGCVGRASSAIAFLPLCRPQARVANARKCLQGPRGGKK